MANTKIEWTDKVWNPITGCTPISSGCAHCFAKRMALRLKGRYGYPKHDPFEVTFHPDRLDEPIRWRKPSKIFVCSMGDLFHECVPDEFLIQVFNTMRMTPKHKYFLLTKRPERMADFCVRLRFDGTGDGKVYLSETSDSRGYCLMGGHGCTGMDWVWLGVSVEDQKTADERIPILLQTPAAKRFVSCEPLLEKIWFRRGVYQVGTHGELYGTSLNGIDWVIAGGETGPGARPLHPDWVRSLRDQCQAAGVPFFFKSWGEFKWKAARSDPPSANYMSGILNSKWVEAYGHAFWKIGNKYSGHLLDGKEWMEFQK